MCWLKCTNKICGVYFCVVWGFIEANECFGFISESNHVKQANTILIKVASLIKIPTKPILGQTRPNLSPNLSKLDPLGPILNTNERGEGHGPLLYPDRGAIENHALPFSVWDSAQVGDTGSPQSASLSAF